MKRDVWKVVADIGIELHPDRVNAIAEKLANLSSCDEFQKLSDAFGPNANKPMMNSLDKCWCKNPDITPLELAAALRGAAATASIIKKRESIEMVWTGPSTGLIPTRHTAQVLREVIDSAGRQLLISSFVAYKIDSIKQALERAIDRNVEIEILLESSTSHGGRVDHDSIAVLRQLFPKIILYVWSAEHKNKTNEINGCVHAKFAVADGDKAFITSANLTAAAMERNMEMGVLVSGGDLPNRLSRHFKALINTRVIEQVRQNDR